MPGEDLREPSGGQVWEDTLQITAAGATTDAIDELLSFRARMVLVDNFTNQYVRIPDASTWVPPLAQGYRVLFPQGTQRARASFETPFGSTVAAAVATQIVVLKWLEVPIITSAVSQQISVVASTTVDGAGVHHPWKATPVTPYTVATGNVIALQPITTGRRFGGFSVAESAGATARVTFYEATSANPAAVIAEVSLLANESRADYVGGPDGIDLAGGLFVERTGGARVALYTKTVATA